MPMNAEVRDALLNKGPYNFAIIATRGSTGAASYRPMAVRICNCLDERSCDYSDEVDGGEVGFFPTTNEQRYTVARCNCYSQQTGMFCDQRYDACKTDPCYTQSDSAFSPCFRVDVSDFQRPGFSCGRCPDPTKGDGFHCVEKDPCENVNCPNNQVCMPENGQPKCGCPEHSMMLNDTCIC